MLKEHRMKTDIKLTIVDSKNEEKVYDYCKPMVEKVVDEVNKKEQENMTVKSERQSKYSEDKLNIVKMCAPSEIELRDMVEDIIEYYKENFKLGDISEETAEINIEVNGHTYKRDEAASWSGIVKVYYMDIINTLLEHCKWMLDKYEKDNLGDKKEFTREYILVKLFYEYTNESYFKSLFLNQLRYFLAHEIFHALHNYEFKVEKTEFDAGNNSENIMCEVFAEFFAMSYINDFCNKTQCDYKDWLYVRDWQFGNVTDDSTLYKEEEKNDGVIPEAIKNIAGLFTRNNVNTLLNSDDYYGGCTMVALAIKNKAKRFGKDFALYKELYNDVLKGRSDEALKKLIAEKGNI